MVMGMVSITSSGFTKLFNNASTTASITAVILSLMATPGNRFAAIIAASAVTSILPKNFAIVVKLR